MNSIKDDIDELAKQSTKADDEANRLSALWADYPDLKKHVGRWKKVAYYSPSVNSRVERFDLRHNCGCCSDSPLEVWPYLETPNGNVYSDPPCFQVGERHWISGDRPYPGWKEKLRKAGLPEIIVGAIGEHFKRCRDERIAMAESDIAEEDDET